MTVSSRAFAAMLKVGPPVTREVIVERDVPVRAPDGADLLYGRQTETPARAHGG
ncbi:MAG: hypothetical protein ACRDOE_13485 [Streptosporangiaceae bacterium]